MKKRINKVTAQAVKRAYHFYAPIYDCIFGSVLEPGRRVLSAEVRSVNPDTLLEVGVGTGILLDHYPKNTKITGIDISEDMLNLAREKAVQLSHMSIQLHIMDAESLTFADGSFDCVVLPYVLSVTPDPNRLIAEARRVCKKDGVIMIVNHFSGSGFWLLLEKAFKYFAERIGFRSEFSFEKNILAHDWQIVRVEPVNLFNLSKFIVIKNS